MDRYSQNLQGPALYFTPGGASVEAAACAEYCTCLRALACLLDSRAVFKDRRRAAALYLLVQPPVSK